MIQVAAVTIRELLVPTWPTHFSLATTVPLQRSPAAHTEAGRLVAVHALRLAGCDVVELPPRSGRRPAWPTGFVGSISHDDALAVAVAARIGAARTLGIDVERHDALDARDAVVVLRDEEREFGRGDSSVATLLWSAKESAYKAWCTGLDVELDGVDPRDIHVTVLESGALRMDAVGELHDRVAPIGVLDGGSLRLGDLLITLAWKLQPAPA